MKGEEVQDGEEEEMMCVICMNPVHYDVDADGNILQENKDVAE
jgi:hypothetical protein